MLVEGREEHLKLWPLGTIPVLVDGELVLPESTSIIEHIDDGRLTADPEARLWDRLADNHLDRPDAEDRHRPPAPEGRPDPQGVEDARAQLDTAYAVFESRLRRPGVARGRRASRSPTARPRRRSSTAAPCTVGRPRGARALLPRAVARPSVARVVDEARPYRPIFPPGFPDDFDA